MRILEVVVIGIVMFAAGVAYSQDIPQGLEDHYLCNALLENGYVMSMGEIVVCHQNYLMLKADFLDITAQEYGAMTSAQQAELMQGAYIQFKAWEEENAELVESLRVAMGQVARDMLDQ